MTPVTTTLDKTTAPPITTVRSPWNSRMLTIDGFLDPKEWSDAAKLPIPKGFLMAKNDATTLYLALDMTEDLFDDTSGDAFALFIDADRDGKRTGYTDLTFSMPLGQKEGLLRFRLGPTEGVIPDPPASITSTARKSFGPTLNNEKPHTCFEIALKLADIDPNLVTAPVPAVRLGIEVMSENLAHESWRVQMPRNLDFGKFIEIALTMSPAMTFAKPGAVIAGIGVISAGDIDGRTGLGKILRERDGVYLLNAAFGGILDFYANAQTLKTLLAAGAKTFAIRARHGATEKEVNAAAWSRLNTHWTNYRWSEGKHIAEEFAANAKSEYRMVDPNTDYRLEPLLFQWSSVNVPDALYQFEIDFLDAKGTKVPAPSQRMTLHIHNRAPVVEILEIQFANRSGSPAIPLAETTVTLNRKFDSLGVVVKAWDAEGFLDGYQVYARYGEKIADINNEFYPAGSAPNMLWSGTKEQAALFVVPASAVYAFRLCAIGRVTDGYGQLLYSETSRILTVKQLCPDRNEHKLCARRIEPPLQAILPPLLNL